MAILVKFVLALVFATLTAAASTQRLLDCTLQSTSISDCDTTAYVGRLAGYAIVGLVFAIFMLLTCPFYYCFRYCCNCCGGRSATMGCCCACGAQPAVYSTMDIVRPKVYLILIIALGIGTSAWGYFSTAQATSGMHGLVNAVNNTPGLLLNQLELINNALIINQYDPTTDTVTQSNLFNGSDLSSKGEELKKSLSGALSNNLGTVNTYIGYFNSAMNAIFALPLILVLIAALCALCNVRTCIPMLTVAFMFLTGFVMWTCHGLFNPLALVSGDLCAEIHGLALNQKTILKPISQCNDTLFSSFLTSFQSIEGTVASTACTQLQNLCYDSSQSTAWNIQNGKVYDCGNGYSCSNVRFGDVLNITESKMVVITQVATLPGAVQKGWVCANHTLSCKPATCASECRDQSTGARSDVGKFTEQTYVALLAAQQVSSALDTLGGQYGSCDALMQLVLDPFDSGCQDLSNGLLSLRDSTGLFGVTSIAFIFVVAWGSKRFMSLPEEEETKEYEMSVTGSAKNPLSVPPSSPRGLQGPGSPRGLQATPHSPKHQEDE